MPFEAPIPDAIRALLKRKRANTIAATTGRRMLCGRRRQGAQ